MEVNILFVFFKINFYNLNIMRFVENLENLGKFRKIYFMIYICKRIVRVL